MTRLLTNATNQGILRLSLNQTAMERKNSFSQRRASAVHLRQALYFCAKSTFALAGGRGNKARKSTNNSAHLPLAMGSYPPAASGAVRSSVVGLDHQANGTSVMTALTISDLNTTIDSCPRVHDLRLAEVLGFAEPRAIRKIIARNLPELETHGPSGRRVPMVKIGSGAMRQVTEYWLNEAQAILITMFSRTEKAAEARRDIIAVYTAYRAGKLSAATARPEDKPFVEGCMMYHDFDGMHFVDPTDNLYARGPALIRHQNGLVEIRHDLQIPRIGDEYQPAPGHALLPNQKHPNGYTYAETVLIIGHVVRSSGRKQKRLA